MKEIRFKVNLFETQPEISKLAYQVAMQYQDFVYTNDKQTVQIVFELLDVEPGDLDGHSAMMYLYMQDGSLYQKPAVIDGNEVQYVLVGNEGNHPGDNKAQAQVIASDGKTKHATTIEPFIVNVGLDRVIAPPEVFYSDFDALIENVNSWFENMTEIIDEDFIEWLESIQDIIDESAATNLLQVINDHIADKVAHTQSLAALPGTVVNGSLIYDSTNNIYWGGIDGAWQKLYLGGDFEKYTEKLVTLAVTTPPIDLSQGNVFSQTLSGATTYGISNAISGKAHSFTLILTQPSTPVAVTWPGSVLWPGGDAPDMDEEGVYALTFVSVDGGTVWLGMGGGGAHVSG